MRNLIRTAITAGAVAASAGAALAADYPSYVPPPIIVPPPELIPLEVVSGWYLRGDIGYKIYSTPDASYDNPDIGYDVPGSGQLFGEDLDDTAVVGVGIGYQFNDYLRTDLTLDYEFKAGFHGDLDCLGPCGDGGSSDEYADIDAWTGLVNVYADLGDYYGFKPYVGGGIGASYLTTSDVYSVNPPGGVPEGEIDGDGDSTWNFAWALTAGTAYQISDRMLLDLNYRYVNLGDAQTGDVNGEPIEINNIDAHEVRVGLRYMLY